MRIVVDTNVLISAAWRNRKPERAVLWITRNHDSAWLVSRDILEEYHAVLMRPKFALDADLLTVWRQLIAASTLDVGNVPAVTFARDPKDARFIACALAGNADLLLTADKDFQDPTLPARPRIIGVSTFCREFVDGENGP